MILRFLLTTPVFLAPFVTHARAAAPLIAEERLTDAGFTLYWQAEIPLPGSDRLESVFLVDDTLYAKTDGGTILAVDTEVGLIRWAERITERNYTIFPPSHVRSVQGPGPVIIPTSTRVHVLDRFSGEPVKRFSPTFAVGGRVEAWEDVMFAGSPDGRFYSARLNLGVPVPPIQLWEVSLDGPVSAAPRLFDPNFLVFATQGGTVYACHPDDKTLYWRLRTNGAILGDPAVDDRGVYVASGDQSLYKVSRGDGGVLWRVRMPRPLIDGPILAADTVYQYCETVGLSALDADKGSVKWKSDSGLSFLSHSVNGDAVWTADRRLLFVDHEGGDVRREIPAPAVTGTVTNSSDDALYVFSEDGRLMAARLAGIPYLRRQQMLAAQAQLNRLPGSRAPNQAMEASPAGVGEAPSSDPFRSRRDRKD